MTAGLAELRAAGESPAHLREAMMRFEMIEKTSRKEVVTKTDDVTELLRRMAEALGTGRGALGLPNYSGARGEIEIGVVGGPQILMRVIK
jgi:hypothetical protein